MKAKANFLKDLAILRT